MEKQDQEGFFLYIMKFLISFFLGIFLFIGSILFLFYNENIKEDLSREEIVSLGYNENILSTSKKLTYEFKKLFAYKDIGEKDFKTPTWMLRIIGFILLWFSLTLFLLAFKKSTNILGILTFLISFGLFFLIILISNIYLFFTSSGKLFDTFGNVIGEKQNNFFDLFSKNFLERVLGFSVDKYFIYFLLFLFFLIIYFLFPKIKEGVRRKFPKKEKKTTFKTYKK